MLSKNIFRLLTLLPLFLYSIETDVTAKKPSNVVYVENHRCLDKKIIVPNGSKLAEHPIPKRLFQTWKTHDLPPTFERWAESWKKNNPEWEYELWDDKDNRDFIVKHFPWFLQKYDSFPKEIYRADIIRYFYLYSFGGIYADLDFECMKSFDPIINSSSIIFGKMGDADAVNDTPNALMASPPKADFWIIAIFLIMQSNPNLGPHIITGPNMLKQAISIYQDERRRNLILNWMSKYFNDSYSYPIEIMPPCYFYPFDWNTDTYYITPCSYARTWWTGTWLESLYGPTNK